jgi:hypothetical protein
MRPKLVPKFLDRLVPALLLAALGGCGSPPLFQVETVVHSDGTCDRTIWQPQAEFLPEEAARAPWRSRWTDIRPVASPPAFAAAGISDGDRKYFMARGSFRGPMEIPDHFRFRVEYGPAKATGQLLPVYERIDHAFVVEHCWRETLTNIVTRDRFLKARDEVIDRGLPYVEAGITRVYGARYDVRGLLRYVRGDGRRFLEQAALVWYDHSAGHGPDEELVPRLAELAREFGLELCDESGKVIHDKDAERWLLSFLRHRVILGVRHRDGSRLNEAEVQSIINPRPGNSPGSGAWTEYWNEHEKEIEARLSAPLLQLFGLYNNPIGFSGAGNPKFEFALRLPGEIVATSGSVDAPDRTSWKFTGDRSFPDGYVMQARSLEIDRQAQQRILGRVSLTDRDQAEDYVQTLNEDRLLREAIGQVHQTGQLRRLAEYVPKSDQDRSRLARLRRLLGLAD